MSGCADWMLARTRAARAAESSLSSFSGLRGECGETAKAEKLATEDRVCSRAVVKM